MSETTDFRYTNTVLVVPLTIVLIIWFVFFIEVKWNINLNTLGVHPRTFSGLKGVLLSPFIHSSLDHLYNNTIPIAILSSALVYFYRDIWIRILIVGILGSGLLTWAIGRPSHHIGMSGLIYVLASFIFFKGIFTKYYRLVALSLFVVFIYGSLIWYIFPVKGNISWEGHLGGFITGLLLAVLIKTKVPSTTKYPWENEDYNEDEDEFLQYFDENGNFIEKKPEIVEEEKIVVKYDYKKNTDKEP